MSDLHPDALAAVERAVGAPALSSLSIAEIRAGHDATAAFLAGPGDERVEASDGTVEGVPCRRYSTPGAVGTVVYLHGGGWVVGTLDTYDTLCRALALHSGATVVSVGYSLAPEVRYPGQVAEAVAVLTELEGDGPLAVAGDSAGAQLALLAAAEAEVDLVALALLYPCLDPALETASARENATGKLLETANMRWYWDQYLGDVALPSVAGPGLPDLEGLPPTLLVLAGHDPLHDEGAALAAALTDAGVTVTVDDHADQIHGFLRHTAVNAAALPTLEKIGAHLRAALG